MAPTMEAGSDSRGMLEGSVVFFTDGHGVENRAVVSRLTRYLTVFEVLNPATVLRVSEVLPDLRIILRDRTAYSGRAVVKNLLHAGLATLCEVTLEDHWQDIDLVGQDVGGRIRKEFAGFYGDWQRLYQVRSEFKVALTDLQSFLHDLRLWLDQVELGLQACAEADRAEREREVMGQVGPAAVPAIAGLFERFEQVARAVDLELEPAHRALGKRLLHPLLLGSPFVRRTFTKPLGYAGDYETVNMMFRDPSEGDTLFAKTVNVYALNLPPIQAHRNRIGYLTEVLTRETLRVSARGRPLRVFNMGCGPAQEVQRFGRECDFSDRAEFTLVDFEDRTLNHVRDVLRDGPSRAGRRPHIRLWKKSLLHLLREAHRSASEMDGEKYDLVYCAGLFDYLADHTCRRAMELFHSMLAPGGLLVVTNVDENPSRHEMEYFLDWYVISRGPKEMRSLIPKGTPADALLIRHDLTGVNILMEVRKPEATDG
jgi:extracellular factor (EF) 3-hydroxypalmitic acid methyl ester biosynthesis protein